MFDMKSKALWAALCFAAAGFSAASNAALLTKVPISGQDCPGYFGGTFASCEITSGYDPNESPVIAKYTRTGGGTWQINTALFPSLTSNAFTLISTGNWGAGVWLYNQGPNDPAIRFYSVYTQAGSARGSFNLYSNDGQANLWVTPTNPRGRPLELSSITFYDSGRVDPGNSVPELDAAAGTGALGLLGGVLALAGERRRRKSST